ncbi:ABC transporter ATP-binding protein [Plantactinospora sp. BC1]|uniref:ABC transporter ATP-binding protein n=1 Tax=Plantactinospora sp. BC1 TaxID=2108470 RepID=UPI00131F076B|nr:ABC transporter ATP-binding protein [Plantactinospora sp. BC1]
MAERLQVVWLGTRLAIRAGGWRVGVIALCSLSLALQPSANALALKLVTDGALAGDWTRAGIGVGTLAAMIAVMFSAYGISVPLQTTVSERAARLFEQDVMRLVTSIPTVEPHERPDFADRLEVLRSNSRLLVGALWTALSNVSFFVGAASALSLLAGADPALLLLPLFGIPLFVTSARAERLRDGAIGRTAEASRTSTHLFRVATTPQFGKEIRIFRLRDEIVSRFHRVSEETNRELFAADLRAALLAAGAWLLFTSAWAGGIVLVAARAVRGEATPGDVVLAIAVAGLVQGYVSGAVGLVRELTQTLAMASRYVWLVEFARGKRTGTGTPPARLTRGIELDRVSFRYPGTDDEVLHDLSVRLPAGATVGIVGDNGAGKTTAVKLLLGLYQPSSGRITVDGVDLADLDTHRWQRSLAGAFQDFARFEFTLGESVGVGDLDRCDEDGAVRAALTRAGSTITLPLSEQLGRAWDGAELSGGQWQQLAVARGMMREQPLLLVLDEPTASLDPDAEHALFERFREATRRGTEGSGAITLLVSHRFSTVRMADLILVFDQGRIVEHGSHQELLALGGVYAELFELQARAYR